jgi:hypothetical protein
MIERMKFCNVHICHVMTILETDCFPNQPGKHTRGATAWRALIPFDDGGVPLSAQKMMALVHLHVDCCVTVSYISFIGGSSSFIFCFCFLPGTMVRCPISAWTWKHINADRRTANN